MDSESEQPINGLNAFAAIGHCHQAGFIRLRHLNRKAQTYLIPHTPQQCLDTQFLKDKFNIVDMPLGKESACVQIPQWPY